MAQRPWITQHADQEWESAIYLIRAATEPMIVLRAFADVSTSLQRLMHEAVADARKQGATWDDIALALRISKQAAHRRFSGDES
jgi:hypothetical protein